MADILNFNNGKGKIFLDPNTVLEGLKDQLLDVLILGWNKEDRLVMSTSNPKASEMIYLLRLGERTIIDKIYGLI